MGEPVRLTEPEMRKVLEPEFAVESFVFGKNPDGTPRNWKLVPLAWKYEKNFRRQVMPMLASTYKPFEIAMGAMASEFYSDISPSIVKAIFDAETAADDFLVDAVHSILIAQDGTITKAWVEDGAETREQLFGIIQKQCEIHKVMDRLGELLAERFVKLAEMMGIEIDLPTLKRLWKQASAKLSARITKVSSIVDSATGQFMDSSLETMSPTVIGVGTPDDRLEPVPTN